MTPNQQAALEQVARDYLEWLRGTKPSNTYVTTIAIDQLVTLLAAQHAAGLEEVEKEVKGRRCELGLKLYPLRPMFGGLREKYEWQDEALRSLEGWIFKRAQEQRP